MAFSEPLGLVITRGGGALNELTQEFSPALFIDYVLEALLPPNGGHGGGAAKAAAAAAKAKAVAAKAGWSYSAARADELAGNESVTRPPADLAMAKLLRTKPDLFRTERPSHHQPVHQPSRWPSRSAAAAAASPSTVPTVEV